MSILECLRVSVETVQQNKIRSFLTMLGVIIGVMSVILLISLGEGAQAYVENEFAGMGSNILIVTPGKQETTMGMVPVITGTYNKLTYENAMAIKHNIRDVRGVVPVVLGAGFIQYGDRRRDTTILGVNPDFEPVREIYARVGRFIQESDMEKNKRVCVLGVKVKQELFGHKNPLQERVSINRSKHTVIGILEPKGMSLGINLDDIVLIPIPSAQRMFHKGEDELFQMLVSVRKKEDISRVQEQVDELLYEAHDYTEDYTITDQEAMLSTFSHIFRALRIMLAGIASISLLVGGIGIMNIMLVSVRERTREVGIRKAVGATRRDIGLQFLVESITIGLIGGATGITLGWLGTVFMRILYPSLPVGLSAWSVLTAFLFSLFVGVFFGVYPAVKASSLDPVEALRYE